MTGSRQRSLASYRQKRDFARTAEPEGHQGVRGAGQRYVMHHHAASHDHYDLRLEESGVLRSWALPKGPSLVPGEKRLAVEVEDHPMEYGSFEGTIPKGQYGGGTVMLWDEGRWRITGKDSPDHLDFALEGVKLTGEWTLVRTRDRPRQRRRNWLLIKRGPEPVPSHRVHDRSVVTGRTMREIAAGNANGGSETGSPSPLDPQVIPGARRGAMPAKLSPQLATLVNRAPNGEHWYHEIKLDGYRLGIRIERGRVRLLSRKGLDWTARFPVLADRLAELPVQRALLDGEVVALTEAGHSRFGLLQEALSERRTDALVLYLFDVMYLDGHDLRGVALQDRKTVLAELHDASGLDPAGLIRYADHVVGDGPACFAQSCALGLEGIISKRATAPYRSGRTTDWRKLKCGQADEFVVGGYTAPGGDRAGFGALLLGHYQGDRLRYAGRVGAGFSTRQLRSIYRSLEAIRVDTSPFAEPVPAARQVTWVRPYLVVEVEYTERTREGRLRHPVFRGLREDRTPEEVSMPRPTTSPSVPRSSKRPSRSARRSDPVVEGVRISHPNRVVFAGQSVTKVELAEYFASIQDWVLPYLANRLLSLVRCPEGALTGCFYQKHLPRSQASGVPRRPFRERKGPKPYVFVQKIAHVVALVQAGVLEFHVFGSQVADLEHPDLMVFDLDPSPGVAWAEVLRVARALRQRLDDLGLVPFVRLTGGKGVHVVVPLAASTDWDGVKAFAKAVANQLAREDPRRLTAALSKRRRRGKIFIDYLRNSRGATAVACYSPRARPGAPVAVPIRWDELSRAEGGDHYSVVSLPRRLRALRANPWEGFYDSRRPILPAMMRAVGLG